MFPTLPVMWYGDCCILHALKQSQLFQDNQVSPNGCIGDAELCAQIACAYASPALQEGHDLEASLISNGGQRYYLS